MAALTCAFEITNAAGWQDAYDVTVYQLGWRLGGKGASGRGEHARIEEHGLHILLGFYENAFRVLKQAYGEVGRDWTQMFKKHDLVVLMEQFQGAWTPWQMKFPENCDEPGTGGVLPTPWAMIQMILGWLKQLFVDSPRLPDNEQDLDDARLAAASRDHDGVLEQLYELHSWLHAQEANTANDPWWLRDFVTVDLGIAAIKGMIEDGVILPPYDYFKLDTLDFRAWLSNHGAHPVSVSSAYISGMYDLGFSLDGQVGAGTALNGILRMCWTYKGAVMWKMQAGMGDTIFAPLYAVLKQRGVKFEFFSRVDNLGVHGNLIDTIQIGQQVQTKGEYQPLFDVKGIPCWPAAPFFDQLVDGDKLEASGENLEDWWTAWPDAGAKTLKYGVDFDTVVLGCSVGVFPYIAKELIANSTPFAEMVSALGTTQTQAAQLWMSTDLAGLGWTLGSPVLDGYAEPMDTWADMTHLIPREDWPAPVPQNLAYLCSPLPNDGPLPPRTDHGYAQKQNARVVANLKQWLEASAKGLWPSWQPSMVMSQYTIATWNPSDRYVLALPNSVFKRLPADGAGFSNLVMAGDYLKTGMNVGCVEAATMGGMHASRAICGRPEVIIGDDPETFADEAIIGDGGPQYIPRGGDLCMAPPLELTGAKMYSFLVNADMDALTAMIDAQLNAVTAPSGITYKPLMGMAAIVCADITKSYSTTPPDSLKGWMAERDFGVWVPVVRYEGGKPGKIGWYLPYVFVDNVAAMVTGREVFGFFKQTATLTMTDTLFAIDALVIEKFSPASEAKTIRLMTIEGAAPQPPAWSGVKDAFEAIWAAVKATFTTPGRELAWDLMKNMMEDLVTGDVPMVFLKQFRDAGDPTRACYQAVIEAPAKLEKWKNGGFTGPQEISITPADSHPIVQECGLAGAQIHCGVGFWTEMDFVMQPGRVVAQR
jgi:uncharacterized protein with NAD-binding domain and iron-sulfur cluster